MPTDPANVRRRSPAAASGGERAVPGLQGGEPERGYWRGGQPPTTPSPPDKEAFAMRVRQVFVLWASRTRRNGYSAGGSVSGSHTTACRHIHLGDLCSHPDLAEFSCRAGGRIIEAEDLFPVGQCPLKCHSVRYAYS
jgi:hypothetical protein